MVFKMLIKVKHCFAYRALVGQGGQLYCHSMHLFHVGNQLGSINATTPWTTASIPTPFGHVLHVGCDHAMSTQQMAFQSLVGETSPVALPAAEWWALGQRSPVDCDTVRPVHVQAQLRQVFDEAITDLASDNRCT